MTTTEMRAFAVMRDIVEKVANAPSPGIPSADGDGERCCMCGGEFLRWTVEGRLSDEAVEELHLPDCAWVAARKFVGGE